MVVNWRFGISCLYKHASSVQLGLMPSFSEKQKRQRTVGQRYNGARTVVPNERFYFIVRPLLDEVVTASQAAACRLLLVRANSFPARYGRGITANPLLTMYHPMSECHSQRLPSSQVLSPPPVVNTQWQSAILKRASWFFYYCTLCLWYIEHYCEVQYSVQKQELCTLHLSLQR